MNEDTLYIAPEVASAIESNKPVVALESTVIAHGLPRPLNLETARRMEAIIREGGATPATIAIIDGKLCAGLTDDQLNLLAEGGDVKKISTRDVALAVARQWTGATTVASTIWIARKAGIKVFATGGIGGVHRGALPDVSADLPELARSRIIVVCSGAKIVLDLPATREWLETHGVTVLGYECDELPAFYSRKSGLPIDARVDSPGEVAEIFRTQQRLEISRALLVTAPVPGEFELPSEQLKFVLDNALADAARKNIGGRELTPFLLNEMAQLSRGNTLRANVALLENNARIAAQIAAAI
ncbi:MAG: pseudouridine-5'-phosphate glycosidase [Acidobacteria bacterium]|nr:pseudouridine-5'-phosphate glycosidase [Acidobacteriota bacterium]MCA1627198.1 pseudouridine-5'-phosphate glycosidase [Acidobacteriota bacterium]